MLNLQKVNLQADKPWMALKKEREGGGGGGGGDTVEAQTQELYRKFQGILNKLTPQKFQSLAEQALKLEINSEERLSGCIDKIFTKVSFDKFSLFYVDTVLCSRP